ncbi:MAG: TerB family tellurite resistance protein [Rubrimonas sp.]|uniref:tellurite resistance TerB family protein n=1 Tax=Rubrimonas sp. TaxID=2036015 RepID=UPI002FDCBF9B
MSGDVNAMLERFKGVQNVVEDQEKFIRMLGVGEDAYKSLKIARNVGTVVNVSTAAGLGGFVATTSPVAGTFFASTGWLATIGLAPAALTPIGWVVAAAILSGGAYFGAMRAFGAYRNSLVDTVPHFVNAPIDLLGAALVDMMGAMAIRVAAADGAICDEERAHIRKYFADRWGIDPAYADVALTVVEENVTESSLEEQVDVFARFMRRNPDCKLDKLRERVEELLTGLVEADDRITPEETAAIAQVLDGLKNLGKGGSLPDLRYTWVGRVFLGVDEASKREATT